MELYLNSASDWSIQDEKGKKFTIESAKLAYQRGKVKNWNLSFQRLIDRDFNLQAVKDYFNGLRQPQKDYQSFVVKS